MLQVHRLVKALEQALPTAQDDRRDRDRELLDASGAQRLANHVRPTLMPTSFLPAASRARATASSRLFTNAGVQHALHRGEKPAGPGRGRKKPPRWGGAG